MEKENWMQVSDAENRTSSANISRRIHKIYNIIGQRWCQKLFRRTASRFNGLGKFLVCFHYISTQKSAYVKKLIYFSKLNSRVTQSKMEMSCVSYVSFMYLSSQVFPHMNINFQLEFLNYSFRITDSCSPMEQFILERSCASHLL